MRHGKTTRRTGIRDGYLLAAAFVLAVLAGAAGAPSALAADDPTEESRYLRVKSEEGRRVALEIACREFRPRDGEGPAVTLAGVVHIGDVAYYAKLQELLADHEIVLYESVKPAGTGGAGGETDPERVASTRAALGFVAALLERYHAEHGRYPADLEALRAYAAKEGPRLAQFLDLAIVDAWGRTLEYELPATVSENPGRYRLLSYGADGAAGGADADADVALADPAAVAPLENGSEHGIQVQLARALDLSFQLEAIDYEKSGWWCSDMSMDQLQRAMAERGADFTLVEGTLAGSTFPAKLAKVLLGLLRLADAFTGGAISDTMKVVMIEMLGDESVVKMSLGQLDEAFAEVIIGDRNQVVVDDLRRVLAHADDVESVAIFYGAGHMHDLEKRLTEQLGYEAGEARWFRAIDVDLADSAVTEADVKRLRAMVQQMIKQMERGGFGGGFGR